MKVQVNNNCLMIHCQGKVGKIVKIDYQAKTALVIGKGLNLWLSLYALSEVA